QLRPRRARAGGAARVDRRERMGDPHRVLTHRHAEEALAEVEREHGAGAAAHACPASSARVAYDTPSSSIAAGRRSSAGTSKMIESCAATVSQAFCLISCSSWPAAQPE